MSLKSSWMETADPQKHRRTSINKMNGRRFDTKVNLKVISINEVNFVEANGSEKHGTRLSDHQRMFVYRTVLNC